MTHSRLPAIYKLLGPKRLVVQTREAAEPEDWRPATT